MAETIQDVSRRKINEVELTLLRAEYDHMEALLKALLKDGIPYGLAVKLTQGGQ